MSTPEKPRPSVEETLRRIADLIADVDLPAAGEPPLIVEGPMPSTDITKLNVLIVAGENEPDPFADARLLPVHRRSCQHDGPPGPDCPGCTEIDELLTIAHINAAPTPPPPPDRGWLARALLWTRGERKKVHRTMRGLDALDMPPLTVDGRNWEPPPDFDG